MIDEIVSGLEELFEYFEMDFDRSKYITFMGVNTPMVFTEIYLKGVGIEYLNGRITCVKDSDMQWMKSRLELLNKRIMQ